VIRSFVDWVAGRLVFLRDHGLTRIDATSDAAENWVAHVNFVADQTLYPACNSWYLGANIPGKPPVLMPPPGFPAYVEKCNDIGAHAYEDSTLSGR
jgi:hypothetical protein